jgi:alpha-tubulin suppressor-like RCC1 family protein
VKTIDNVVDITSGPTGCALRDDGSVWCWGNGYYGALGNGQTGGGALSPVPVRATITNAVSIASYGGLICAVIGDGTVECWGQNGNGQLGVGTLGDSNQAPPTIVPGLPVITEIAAGLQHTCAIAVDGGVWCWGANGGGQVGDGTFDDRPSPAPVVGLPSP